MATAKPKGIPMRARLKAQYKIVDHLAKLVVENPDDQAIYAQVKRVAKLFDIEE